MQRADQRELDVVLVRSLPQTPSALCSALTMATTHSSDEPSAQNAKGKQAGGGPSSAQPAEGSRLQNGGDTPARVHPENAPRGEGQVPSALTPQAPSAQSSRAPTASTSAPPGPTRGTDTDGHTTDKDKGSVDATLVTRKEAASPSDGAHTATSTTHQPGAPPPKKAKRTRRSFFGKVFRVLVPCVGSSQRAHSEAYELPGSGPNAPPSPPGITEKQPVETSKDLPTVPPAQSAEEAPAGASPVPVQQPESAEPAPAPQEPPAVPQPLTIPPAQEQQEEASERAVIIPPTPTRSLLPPDETEGMTSGAVQPPGSTGEDIMHEHPQARGRESGDESDGSTSFTEDEELDEANAMEDIEDEEERLIMNGGAGIPIGPDGVPRPLLPPISPKHAGRKCLVLDLDETLVHSSFKSIQQADYVVPVEIEYHWHNVYVIKRPGVDNFLKRMGELYEVVVFTASLSKYADPVLDKLDIHHVVSHRLFRESCYNHRGNYVKDLSQLGRPISDTIIIDNSPASYIFHPNNAVPVSSWFNDPHDTELTDLCPFLVDLGQVDDVRGVLDGGL